MEFTVSGDGKGITQVGHISENGAAWHADLPLTYRFDGPIAAI